MKLLIKNKIIYYLKKTIKQASEKEWIPDKMEISIKEARLLLKELNSCVNIDKTLRKTFTIKQTSSDIQDVKFALWQNAKLNDETLDVLCEQWLNEDFHIIMDHCNFSIPIYVVKECESNRETNALEKPVWS